MGQILLQNSQILRTIAGVIIIIFSLQLIGVLNIKFLNVEKKFYTKKSNNIFFVFIVGMAFGFGWTPCIGPILGSILALASTEETIYKAILLLSFYSLGLAIPFILSGYLMQKFLLFSKNFKRNINLVTKEWWYNTFNYRNFNFNKSITSSWLLYFKLFTLFAKLRLIG